MKLDFLGWTFSSVKPGSWAGVRVHSVWRLSMSHEGRTQMLFGHWKKWLHHVAVPMVWGLWSEGTHLMRKVLFLEVQSNVCSRHAYIFASCLMKEGEEGSVSVY